MQPFMGYLSGNDTAGNSRMIRTSGIKIVLEITNKEGGKSLEGKIGGGNKWDFRLLPDSM